MTNPVRAAAAAAVTAGLVLLAGPAFAHVTVDPGEAEQGSYATLTFRVPNESDTASTTEVEVALPAELTSARVKPHPGWTWALTRSGDTVTAVTWRAEKGAALGPGEFDEFDISVGPLPKADSLTFKALQTYSDGSVSRWIQPTEAGQPEPENPAPVLRLTPAGAGAPARSPESPVDDDSKAPLVLSIIALVVAIAGAGVAAVAGVTAVRRRA